MQLFSVENDVELKKKTTLIQRQPPTISNLEIIIYIPAYNFVILHPKVYPLKV